MSTIRKYEKVNNANYVCLQGWMIKELQLKGNELIIFAIIYGFSQAPGNKFQGSLQYLADWTGTTKETVQAALKKLLNKNLIIKEPIYVNKVKYVRYFVNYEILRGIQEIYIPIQESYIPIQESYNNNIDNNITNNIDKYRSRRGNPTISDNFNSRTQEISSENNKSTYTEMKDMEIEDLERLKQIVLENRHSQKIKYRDIQNMFNLIDTVTYDTPLECTRLIEQKRNSLRTERSAELGPEVF